LDIFKDIVDNAYKEKIHHPSI